MRVVRVERGELPPHLLDGDIVVGGEPLGDDGAPVASPAAEHRPGIAQIGDVERVVGDGPDEATRPDRRDLRARQPRPLHQVQELLLRRVERLLDHVRGQSPLLRREP